MSLRVLLADESSTIKKVMQLALQDFGVEVKAVALGIDVLQVAKTFKPDIIFADVLLSKKSGYEVSAELKSDPGLKHIPVVLMWSGFMEIDEKKATDSQADRRLEKPFDADTLRGMVKDLISKSEENIIASYLTFPDMPPIIDEMADSAPSKPSSKSTIKEKPMEPQISLDEIPELEASEAISDAIDEDEIAVIPQMPAKAPSSNVSARTPSRNQIQPQIQDQQRDQPTAEELNLDLDLPEFSMELEDKPALVRSSNNKPDKNKADAGLALDANEYDEIHEIEEWEEPEEFSQVPLTSLGKNKKQHSFELPPDEPWSQSSIPEMEIATPDFAQNISAQDSISSSVLESPAATRSATKSTARTSKANANDVQDLQIPQLQIDPLRMEEILREEARSVIENIAWKILPDVIERVVREEITRLTKEAERL